MTSLTTPKISVIMPMYNAARYVDAALASVLTDSAPDIEVLVIDDGSSDEGPDLVALRSRLDPRLRLLRTGRRAGPAGARNMGLDAARGQWVAPLDADDTYAPGRLARLLTIGDTSGADLVADNLRLFGPRQAKESSVQVAFPWPDSGGPRSFSLEDLLEGEMPKRPWYRAGYMKPILRRTFVARHHIRFDETLRLGEDCIFLLECMILGARAVRIGEALYNYRVGQLSVSSRPKPEHVDMMYRAISELGPRIASSASPRAAALHERLLQDLRRRRAALEAMVLLKELRFRAAMTAASRHPDAWPVVIAHGWSALMKRIRSGQMFGKTDLTA